MKNKQMMLTGLRVWEIREDDASRAVSGRDGARDSVERGLCADRAGL